MKIMKEYLGYLWKLLVSFSQGNFAVCNTDKHHRKNIIIEFYMKKYWKYDERCVKTELIRNVNKVRQILTENSLRTKKKVIYQTMEDENLEET